MEIVPSKKMYLIEDRNAQKNSWSFMNKPHRRHGNEYRDTKIYALRITWFTLHRNK